MTRPLEGPEEDSKSFRTAPLPSAAIFVTVFLMCVFKKEYPLTLYRKTFPMLKAAPICAKMLLRLS